MASAPSSRIRCSAAWLASPVLVIFLSSNFVNAGNLGFNLLFSRLMGPGLFGDLATLLTLKLAILGVLGAVQMAVSEKVAAEQRNAGTDSAPELYAMAKTSFVILWFALPVLAGLVWVTEAGTHIGLKSSSLLIILLLSLPFTLPLAIARGVALGRLDAPRFLLSANVEMLTRLIGGWLAWECSLGIEGVVASVGASIVFGTVVLHRVFPPAARRPRRNRATWRLISMGALPFAFLQLGQVALLDGDVVIAKVLLGQTEAGYVAALSLFQRIQFYACFGLAMVLLPAVAHSRDTGQGRLRIMGGVLLLFLAVSTALLGASLAYPTELVTLLVGEAFAPAGRVLPLAVGSAIAFTLCYMLATYIAGLGDRMGIVLILLTSPFQLAMMSFAASGHHGGLGDMLFAKFSVLASLAVALVVYLSLRNFLQTGMGGSTAKS